MTKVRSSPFEYVTVSVQITYPTFIVPKHSLTADRKFVDELYSAIERMEAIMIKITDLVFINSKQ